MQPGLYPCLPDSICGSIGLYLLEMDTAARVVNTKGTKYVNDIKFSKGDFVNYILPVYVGI